MRTSSPSRAPVRWFAIALLSLLGAAPWGTAQAEDLDCEKAWRELGTVEFWTDMRPLSIFLDWEVGASVGLKLHDEGGNGHPGCLVARGGNALQLWVTDWDNVVGRKGTGSTDERPAFKVGSSLRLSPRLAKNLAYVESGTYEIAKSSKQPTPKTGVVFEIEVKNR